MATVTLELPDAIAQQLQAHPEAAALVENYLRSVLPAPAAPRTPDPRDQTLALLDEWAKEDATDDPEEKERRDADLAALQEGINAERRRDGARLIYS